MSIITFPDAKIVSDNTIEIGLLGKHKKDYYKNIIRTLDEMIYFNYLKGTDPRYGLNIQTQLSYYIKQDIGISLIRVLYFRTYPDDEEIDMEKFILVQQDYNNIINKR